MAGQDDPNRPFGVTEELSGRNRSTFEEVAAADADAGS
jgi:hypothetical protein